MRIYVKILSLPTNSSLPLPLYSEAALLPAASGYFRFLRSERAYESPARVSHASPEVMLPLTEKTSRHLKDMHLVGAIRALLSLSASQPIRLLLGGSAAHINGFLHATSPAKVDALVLDLLRVHAYSALPFRVDRKYQEALRAAFPACDESVVLFDLVALLAPAILRARHRSIVVLDPYALTMTGISPVWADLQSMPPEACVGAVSDHLAPTGVRVVDSSLLLLRNDGLRARGWRVRLASALRRAIAQRVVHAHSEQGRLACPRRLWSGLLDSDASGPTARASRQTPSDPLSAAAPSQRSSVCVLHELDCAAAYAPLAHHGLYELGLLQSEGSSSIYALCRHELLHQAFARAGEAQHSARYSGRLSCGCGQRISTLLPPRDIKGKLLNPQNAPLHSFLGKSGFVFHMSAAWASFGRLELQWLLRRTMSRAAPARAYAIADRSREGEPLLTFGAGQPPAPPATDTYDDADTDLDMESDASNGNGTGIRTRTGVRAGAGANRGAETDLSIGSTAVGMPHARASARRLRVVYPCGYAGAEEAFLVDLLLAPCAPRVSCLVELLRDFAAGEHARVRRVMRNNTLFVLQSAQFAMVKDVARVYGVARESLHLVHISNGNIYADRILQSLASYEGWRRPVFRQYWVPDDEMGMLASASALGDVQWFPIGMNPQWMRLIPAIANGSLPLPRASERTHLVSFLGSTHKSARAPRIAAVEKFAAVPVYHHAGDRACYGANCQDTRYIDETLQSAFCLHLPGSSVESNRLYEQLEGGCVPLVVDEFGPGEEQVGTVPLEGDAAIAATEAAFAPLDAVTGQRPPFVRVTRKTELRSALQLYFANSDALNQLQQRNLEWWQLAKAHFTDRFQRAVCPN